MSTDEPGLTLHMHPLASYCWKVLLALYEAGTPFRAVRVDGSPKDDKAFVELWPIAKMPLLADGLVVIPETTIIIDYLQTHHPGAVILIPMEGEAAREVRLWDRFFDLYIHAAMQKCVTDRLRPEDRKDPAGVEEAHATLDTAYAMLERWMVGREWAAGSGFSMADCAAMPALFYAEAVRPFSGDYPTLSTYFERLAERPASRRVIREAQPWLQYFPFVEALDPRFLSEQD